MPKKSWTKMTARELATATRKFNSGPGLAPTTPAPEELAKHLRAIHRGPGRPRLGKGAVRVLFTMDPKLLRRLDAYARKHGTKRSALISQSVKAYMDQDERPALRRNAETSAGLSPTAPRPAPLAATAG
jgi:hypothetical protein